ncbi:hypothetical protein ASPCAL06375 [Aspergillus calidoustus]|uniref:Uncharacterized protein n=1 Tax=Aspergillus calidoustus TaxID=454130 RepID=A0A0U5C920_ASPCI|nr:hypothetical protein ASPCAL06375 [Aspergillus calidoustus]
MLYLLSIQLLQSLCMYDIGTQEKAPVSDHMRGPGRSNFETSPSQQKKLFVFTESSLSLPDFGFRTLLRPMELLWTKTRRRRLFSKSITRHACDDVVVPSPVTTLIHQVVSSAKQSLPIEWDSHNGKKLYLA